MQFLKCIRLIILLGLCFSELCSADTLPACTTQVSANLCAKIGQMLIIGFGGLRQDKAGKIIWQDPDGAVFNENSNIAKAIKNQHIGGVILFNQIFRNPQNNAYIRARNIQSPAQVSKLTQALQTYALQTHNENSPLLVTIDQEGGMVTPLPASLGFSQTPTLLPQALGASEDRAYTNMEKRLIALKQTRQHAEHIANVLFDNHFNVNLAPCTDVNINPLNPVIGGIGRSFSDNPQIVADQAVEFIHAFHTRGILATLKHFPGHGSSIGDTHTGLVDVTDTYQMDKELLPYRILINNNYHDLIMTTHVINGQIDKSQCKSGPKDDPKTWCPGTMSYVTLTKLLREQLGFKGVIVSDDMTMKAISKEYPLEVALEKAINAGIDMFILANHSSNDTEKVINTIAKLVKEGKVSETQIDRAYLHISTLKNQLKNTQLTTK